MAEMPLVGEEFAGYRLVEVLGRGGMSVVFRAENPRLGNVIALKVLDPSLAANDTFRTRFLAESRIAASMNHPNVIPIHDTGSSGGLLYLAMRCVAGTDLRQILRQHGRLPAARAIFVLDQAARALDAAHRRGLVHRDVKPANLLVERGSDGADPEHVYLADFGITKHLAARSGPTSSGAFLGTIDYVAPEQIRGLAVLGLADQYSLGCVLYECLTGHAPFEKEFGTAVIWAHVEEQPPPPSMVRRDLPAAVDAVFSRVLAKDPGERYENCREFVLAARRALGPAVGAGAEVGAGAGVERAAGGWPWPLRTPRPQPAPVPAPLPAPLPGEWGGTGSQPGLPSGALADRQPGELAHEGTGRFRSASAPPGAADPGTAATWPPAAAVVLGGGAAGLWGAGRPAPPVPGDPADWPDLPAADPAGEPDFLTAAAWREAEAASAADADEMPWSDDGEWSDLSPDESSAPDGGGAGSGRASGDWAGAGGPPGRGRAGRGRADRGRRRPRRGWLVGLALLMVAALTATGVVLRVSGGHGGPAEAASAKGAGAAAGSASPAMGASAAASAAPSMGTGTSMTASSSRPAGPGSSTAAGAGDCTSEQPGNGQSGPTTLTAVLADASRCSVPRGIIASARCKTQPAPTDEQVVVCTSPTAGISQVTFRTYPTLAALYAAYTSSVKSLAGTSSFQQNTTASCGNTGATYAEAGWNHQELHPRQYTVAQLTAGRVPQLDAMGRLACFAAGKTHDLVWTTGVGRMLAVATSTGPAGAVYNWWAEIHHVIIFPGTEMCGMSARMDSVPLGNLVQEPVCPAGAGMAG